MPRFVHVFCQWERCVDFLKDLSNALASAQPKIQKMCEEESDDHEAVAKLFEINDSIHRTLERYRLIKSGDVDGASRIPRGTLGMSGAGVRKGPDNELSLIDFGPADNSSAPETGEVTDTNNAPPEGSAQGSSLENDLIGLSLGDNTQNAGGQISLGGGPAQPPTQASASSKQSIMDAFNSPQPTTFSSPPPPVQHQVFPPQPQSLSQQLTPQTQTSLLQTSTPTPHQPPPPTDPFATLTAINSTARTSSPFQFQQASTPRPPPQQAPPPSSTQHHQNGSTEDEWTFSSSLPGSATELTVLNSSLHITFLVSRPPGSPTEMLIRSSVSNNTASPVADLTFQAAVSKGTTLKMEPQSAREIAPRARGGITQVIRLYGVEVGKGASVKVRWKVGYWLGGERREEEGTVGSLGIS